VREGETHTETEREYACFCVRKCVRMCVCVCMRACVRGHARACACVRKSPRVSSQERESESERGKERAKQWGDKSGGLGGGFSLERGPKKRMQTERAIGTNCLEKVSDIQMVQVICSHYSLNDIGFLD